MEDEQERTKTEVAIEEMLKENTGAHFLDSGGWPKYDEDGNYVTSKSGYGRAHEINSKRDFKKEPKFYLDVYVTGNEISEVIVRGSLYHFLRRTLEFSHVKTDKFYKFAEDMPTASWGEVIEYFVDTSDNIEKGGSSLYTYNFYFPYDQDIVVQPLLIEGEETVLLRTHNGCDARGGFSSPLLFDPQHDNFVGLVTLAEEALCCSCCRSNYYRDGLKFREAPSVSRGTAVSDYNVIQVDKEKIDKCFTVCEDILNSSLIQVGLDGTKTKVTDKEAMEQAILSVVGDTDDKLLYCEDYTMYQDYLQCPLCKIGRIMPTILV